MIGTDGAGGTSAMGGRDGPGCARRTPRRRPSGVIGAAAADQLVGLLRADRLTVTQRECDTVATTLRMLAEQVSDQASALSDNEDHLAIAEALGSLAQALR